MNPSFSRSTIPNRETLLLETLQSTPQQLHTFVIQAFTLFDEQVAQRQRSYAQASAQDMRNIAINLYSRHTSLDPALVGRLAAAAASSSTTAPPQPQSLSRPSASARKRGRCEIPVNKAELETFVKFTRGSEKKNHSATFVGRSTDLERKYSRDAPSPEDIRPVSVLIKAFEHIVCQAKAKERSDGSATSKKYLSDQLKGMRQDLRVQDIKTDFTVKVYEMHAMISLESGDIGEFNQCQAALKWLYLAPGINRDKCSIAHFFCYRIVYLSLGQQFDSLSTELMHYTNLYLKRKQVKSIVHHIPRNLLQLALRLAFACDIGDISVINRILQKFPVEMQHLLRIFLQRRRVIWLGSLLTGVQGEVTLELIASSLGFLPTQQESGSSQDITFWLDGSAEEAEQRWKELFTTLKVDLPPQCFTSGSVDQCTVKADMIRSQVEMYVKYLGTRQDAIANE